MTDESFEAVRSRLGPRGTVELVGDITQIAASMTFTPALDLREPSDIENRQRLVDVRAALAAGQQLTYRLGVHVTGRASPPEE